VAFLGLLLGIVLKLCASEGTLVVEVNQPDAEVSVDDGKVTIKTPGDSQPVQLQVAEGKHTRRVTKGGFETFTKEFTISSMEFHTLNRCLDTAIAEAVTEYERLEEEARSRNDLQHRGQIAHELRNFVHTALLSLKVIQAGSAGPSARASGVLGRSLAAIRELADSIGTEARPEQGLPPPCRAGAPASPGEGPSPLATSR
jgi:signal transduction histidine kinase